MIAISREKVYRRGGRFAWSWAYTVKHDGTGCTGCGTDGEHAMGTGLASARAYARKLAGGAAIVETWRANARR